MLPARPLTETDAVLAALGSSPAIFIEDGCRPIRSMFGLALSVRTDTAFRLPLAAIFTEALRIRLSLPREVTDLVELALHEVVANAIIHGNLEISSNGRGSSETYGDFCSLLDTRLQDPIAAGRTVLITAHWPRTRLAIAVTDEGSGFDGAQIKTSDDTAHGRGLSMVRELASRAGWNQQRKRFVCIFKIGPGIAA